MAGSGTALVASGRIGATARPVAWLLVALICLIAIPARPWAATPEPLVFHAASSGRQTLDQGEGGGNPFASALIELLQRPSLALAELPAALRRLTHQKSRGFQDADVPAATPASPWSVKPAATGERRIALVLIVSDYSRSGGAQSLPGALNDGGRVMRALSGAGFAASLISDRDRAGMRRALAAFSARSSEADAAVIYTTGHGVEVDGEIYLLPGDYPVAERNRALQSLALPLGELKGALGARRVNLLFYGGCRDNPFGG